MSFLPRKYLKDGTGVFKFQPLNGHPDSETVAVTLYNPSGSELQASAAMSTALDTTVDADSGPSESNPYLLNVAVTSGVTVGDLLLVRNGTDGQSETVEVYKVNSGASFQCKNKLIHSYASGDTVDSLAYTYSITTTHTAALGKFFRAEMAYAVNSIDYVDVLPFHVKEHVYSSQLNSVEMYRLFRDLREYEGFQDNYDDQIIFAFDELASDLAALNLDLDNFLPGRLEICHAYKSMVIISRRWLMDNPEIGPMVEKYEEAYKVCFDGIAERSSYYDKNEDGVSDLSDVNVDQWYRGTASFYDEDSICPTNGTSCSGCDDCSSAVTAANVGLGTGDVFRDKTNNTINLRTLSSQNSLMVIANAADQINLTIDQGLIDHDALLNFLSAEHFTEASIDHDNILNSGAAGSHATIAAHIITADAHFASTADPHDVQASQVEYSNTTSGLTATEVQAAIDEIDGVVDTLVAAGGEANTASNVGALGEGVYKQKTGVDLELRKIRSSDSSITVTGEASTIALAIVDSTIDHDALTNFASNEHFTEASIDHTAIANIGTNSHAAIDTHVADGTVHFTEGSVDHTAIANIGTNSHAAVDTHIADGTIHFTEGSIDHTAISNIGTHSHSSIDTHIDNITPFYNGAEIETADVNVIEDTGTVKLQIEASGGGDISFYFASTVYTLDCTPICSVNLTAGTDISPTLNYVYVLESGGTLTLTASTSDWPTGPHSPIATVLVQSAASVAIDGAYKIHAWTDHISNETENGHLSHVNKKLRGFPATWDSGTAGADLVAVSTDGYLSTTAGVVFQLHNHAMQARDMQTGDPLFVVNDPTTAFLRITSLASMTQDANGTSLSNKYFNLILWGAVNEDEADCKILANLPAGVYSNEANAISDTDATAVYQMDGNFAGVGFLIARYTLRLTVGGVWSQSAKEDLRGLLPSTSVGGSGISDHGGLAGLSDDDHSIYLLVDGTRAMTGALDMGTAAITNVGNVDGVDVSAHAADSTIHFTEGSIDHVNIASIGTNAHSAIDTHIADTTIHYIDDDIVTTRPFKEFVRAATTANITLSGAQTIDGVSIVADDDVLVKDQTTGTENGIYVASASAWSRRADLDAAAEAIPSIMVAVSEGTTQNDTLWMMTDDGVLAAVINWARVGGEDSKIVHQDVSGSGTNTHALIDTHIADTAIHIQDKRIYREAVDFNYAPFATAPSFTYNNGTNRDIGITTLADTDDEYFSITDTTPADLDTSGNVTFQMWAYSKTAAASKNVAMKVDRMDLDDGDDWDTAFSNVQTSTNIAMDATQDNVTLGEWTETVSSLGLSADVLTSFRFVRVNALANDLPGDLLVIAINIILPVA